MQCKDVVPVYCASKFIKVANRNGFQFVVIITPNVSSIIEPKRLH